MELTQMTREIIQQFRTLSAIPHPSGREAGLAHALAEIFQSMGGTVQTDALWNLRCDFPATAGLEQAPCVCIQGHLDMVCATAPGSHYHPDQDGIVCRTEDGWLKSDGRSSLGADNLLAGSAALWLLRQRFRHGPIRLLFTTREERALDGAKALDPRWLDGVHYLINTDGFQENRIIVGSAGGCYQIWTRTMETAPDPRPAYRVALSGFPGGHSGSDIGKGRINPLRLLAALLAETDADIAALTGGSAMNAIPSEAAAVVVPKDLDRFRKALDRVPQLGGAVALSAMFLTLVALVGLSSVKTAVENEWYGYMNDYLTYGNDCENLGTAWGMYKSRLSDDMGIAIGLATKNSGNYEPGYFYGAATPTEARVSATLNDLAVSFVVEYIMGQKTDENWESFKQSWYELGGTDWTNEVNAQYNNIINPQ